MTSQDDFCALDHIHASPTLIDLGEGGDLCKSCGDSASPVMFFRHFPGRSQRSKCNNIKLGLKVCFLVAVCLWLMYQVKSRSGFTIKIVAADDTKLGRKDLNKPKMKETVTTNEETVADEENNKLDDDDEEQDLKSEKKYDLEEDLMENEENVLGGKIGLDTTGRGRYTNKTIPLKIDEESLAHQNTLSGIESTTALNDDATFGDVTGLNQTMDTEDKTTMIEDGPLNTKIADEIQHDSKGFF